MEVFEEKPRLLERLIMRWVFPIFSSGEDGTDTDSKSANNISEEIYFPFPKRQDFRPSLYERFRDWWDYHTGW